MNREENNIFILKFWEFFLCLLFIGVRILRVMWKFLFLFLKGLEERGIWCV